MCPLKTGLVMTDALTFSRQVDDVLAGCASRDFSLTLGDIPAVYVSLGVQQFKLVIMQSTLRKIIQKHALSVGTIKQLPGLLKAPIMVFRSATEPDALVAVIDAKDKNGDTVIAIIHPDRRHKQHRVNLIASVYGKSRACWFREQIDKGLLLYADKEKALRWPQSARLQLPGEVTATRHTTNIPRCLQTVKGNPHLKTLKLPEKKGSDHENQ